jgi:hypothetical protein
MAVTVLPGWREPDDNCSTPARTRIFFFVLVKLKDGLTMLLVDIKRMSVGEPDQMRADLALAFARQCSMLQ